MTCFHNASVSSCMMIVITIHRTTRHPNQNISYAVDHYLCHEYGYGVAVHGDGMGHDGKMVNEGDCKGFGRTCGW